MQDASTYKTFGRISCIQAHPMYRQILHYEEDGYLARDRNPAIRLQRPATPAASR